MARPQVIGAGLVFFGTLVLGTGLIAQQNPGGGGVPVNPAIKALMEARLGVAKEIYESIPPSKIQPVDEMSVWSRRWMDDQIRLDPDPSKTLAAIQGHLDRMRRLEAIVEAHNQSARATHADVLKMKYFRLEAEQMIAEIRIVTPGLFPPKPAAKP